MLASLKISDIVFPKKEIRVQNLPIDQIRPNPYQPRRFFDKRSMDELAQSIKQYGVIQPISVRFINGCSYELVAGERRIRACQIAGLQTIPAMIVNVSDNDSAVLALIENIQRQDLNFLEEAEGYQNLMSDYRLTQEELATKLGKSQSAVTNKLRILRLSSYVKKLLLENDLTEGHAKALLKIPDSVIQQQVLLKVIQLDLSARKTEELVDETIEAMMESEVPKKLEQKIKRRVNDIRLFTNTIHQSVDIMRKSGVMASYNVDAKEDCYEIKIKIQI